MNALNNVSIKFGIAAIVLCILLASNGKTQETSAIEEPSSLDPELGVELRYDDNIFHSATGVKSSWVTIISPSLSVTAKPSEHRYTIRYDGDVAWYSDNSPENYDDHYLQAGAYFDFSTRSKLDFVGSYEDAHQNRGTGLSEGFDPAINIPPNPDEYRLAQILGRFSFGSNASKGQLVVETGYGDLEYTNNRDRTRFFDRGDTYGDATIYFRVMPKTSLLIEARVTDIDYQFDRPLQLGLDNTEYRYLFGVTSDTSAKINGTVKVGYVEKTYADNTRGDFSEPSWELDIRWSPLSYSHFDFETRRFPSEVTSGTGDAVDITTYSIAWNHQWNTRLESRIEARYLDEDFRASTTGRSQELTQYNFILSYQLRRWLKLQAGVKSSSRDSNIDRFVFDGNVYSISALMTP